MGLKRSGTSLLRSLLDGHPRLWVLPRETKTFRWRRSPDPVGALLAETRYAECFPPGTPAGDAFLGRLRERLPDGASVAEAIRAVAEAAAAVEPPPDGAEVWIEKTPDHLLHVPELLDAFGDDTRIVATLRDPRAQVASRARRREPGERFPIPRFAGKWALGEELIRRWDEGDPRVHVVRYEDLVLDTRAAMEPVARHLGVPWDDGLVEPWRDGGSWTSNSSYGERVSGIGKASLRRWREQLTPAQVRTLEGLLGPRMERRGYAPEVGRRAWSRWMRPWMERRARAAARRHVAGAS